jgi:branched-chain amino acid aminotransferase
MTDVAYNQYPGAAAFADGRFVAPEDAKVSLFDWGFTRSDATYDVASVWQGAFFRLDDHLDRFFASLGKLRLQVPHTRAEVRAILHGCVRGAGLRDAYVAMVCTRGVPPRGARDPRLATNRFYAYALPFVWIAPPEKQRAGIDLHVSARHRIAPEAVDPTVKNYNWLDLVQSLFDAYTAAAHQLCCRRGRQPDRRPRFHVSSSAPVSSARRIAASSKGSRGAPRSSCASASAFRCASRQSRPRRSTPATRSS